MSLFSLVPLIAVLIGASTILLGIFAFLLPKSMSKKFGVAADGLALAYVRATGIRDVFIGLTVFILLCSKAWQALGAVSLCLGIVALADAWVVRTYGKKKMSLVHLTGAAVVFAYGIWLLRVVSQN